MVVGGVGGVEEEERDGGDGLIKWLRGILGISKNPRSRDFKIPPSLEGFHIPIALGIKSHPQIPIPISKSNQTWEC